MAVDFVRRLEAELVAAKARHVEAVRELKSIGAKLRAARVAAGVYESPNAALFAALEQRPKGINVRHLMQLLGCTQNCAHQVIWRAYVAGRLVRVKRGVYARPKAVEAALPRPTRLSRGATRPRLDRLGHPGG